jgi:hypothetical protein
LQLKTTCTACSLGGATVFPNAGVAIQPDQGSIVFWWNLHTNGWTDRLTVHGGCPVLVGSKWITNKWVRWGAQRLKLPCRRAAWRGTSGSQGFERQPLLTNTMCLEPAYSATKAFGETTYSAGPPAYPLCSLEHQVVLRADAYYEALKQFDPGFS